MPSVSRAKAKTTATPTGLVAAKGPAVGPGTGRDFVALQNVVLALQGVCTEPGVFYAIEGQGWVGEGSGTVYLGPDACLKTPCFANIVGLGNWHRAASLDGLFLALLGSGTLEIKVFQVKTGRSWERLICEVYALSPEQETVIDLSHHLVNGAEGGLWFELRNCSSTDGATLTGARYLTRGKLDVTMKLALVVAEAEEPGAKDAMVAARLQGWCRGAGQAFGAGVVRPAAGTPAVAQLAMAKAQGFSHAVLMDPSSLIDPETLGRLVTGLSLARGPQIALGGAMLDDGEKWLVQANGLSLDLNGKAAPNFQGTDLRDPLQVVEMETTLAEDTEEKLLFQPEFLALSLANLPQNATAPDAGFDSYLRELGFKLVHLTGIIVNRAAVNMAAVQSLVTLQHVIYPEAGLCTEQAMFYHPNGPTSFRAETGTLNIDQRSIVHFDSYFNALNIGKWHATCKPEGLYLGLTGRGRVLVKVFHAIPDRSWELLCDAAYSLSATRETMIDLSHYAKTAVTGMIYFELHAISQGVQLTGARFAVPGKINPDVKLCLSITTFKREAEVENTARRMEAYFKTCDFADQMHLNIVDNGNSANIVESAKITKIPNANLGGAGGFTRGLIEGQAAGYSHVLFMDDDASIPMEALHRAYAFLTLSKDPKATVAGAMISNSDKWRMWENGAIFDRNCRPQFNGVDLRNWTEVMNMEFASASSRSSKMYGGWWFFAFPVAQVTRFPFPFFVRGDDINFSLANDFNITTLNGIVSFAEDFSDKESPMTLYLDLRNHMVQHLTVEKMEIGPLAIARIGIGFFLRNIYKFQYETCEALLMAWTDVLKGPEFFAENADAAAQRAAVKAIYKVESWKPVAELDRTERRRFWAPHGFKQRVLHRTFNGHLLPFYRLWANRIVLQPRDRNNFDPVWGASKITYLNSTRDKGYTVAMSRTRFFALWFRLIWLTLRLMTSYSSLLARYRKGHAEITVPGFWQKALKLGKADAKSSLVEKVSS